AAPRRELYDTSTDPAEAHDLAAENPRRADALERALQDIEARTAAGAVSQRPQEVDADVEERLRALGYVGGTVSPRTLDARPRGRDSGACSRSTGAARRRTGSSPPSRRGAATSRGPSTCWPTRCRRASTGRRFS